MKAQTFLQMDEGMEHEEHLYLLEVLVDKLEIDGSKVPGYVLEPYGPLLVRAKFLHFPDLEFDQGKRAQTDVADIESGGEENTIPGLPPTWKVELAEDQPDFVKYPQYRVEIPLENDDSIDESEKEKNITVLVPKSAVSAGEGLRYINAVLKNELDPPTWDLIHQQLESGGEELNKINEYTFAAGKSLLFPMTPYKLIEGLRKSPLYLQVVRSGIYAKDKPYFTLIGQVKLLLGDTFVKAIMVAGNTKVLPVSAHIEDRYPISNVFNENTGNISVFLRLSCFGKSMFELEKNELLSSKTCPKNEQSSCKKKFQPLYPDEYDKPLSIGAANLDEKYIVPVPWRKPWDEMPEFPKPHPVLPPFYEPLPPLPPPPPPKPFDIGEHLPDLPRCSPYQPPPCYRRAGDPPLSYCTEEMESQIRREEQTKFTQTDLEKESKLKQTVTNTEKTVLEKPSLKTQDKKGTTNQCKSKTDCDGGHFIHSYSREEGFNMFDGDSFEASPKPEQEEIPNRSKPIFKSHKKCTCPKIPDLLLPEKPQCTCPCAGIKAKLMQEKKAKELIIDMYKGSIDGRSSVGSESNKGPHERKKMSEQGDVKEIPSQTSIGKVKKKLVKEQKLPKNDSVFFLPGADSSTFIALTSREYGHDMKRFLENMKDTPKRDHLFKYIDPDPLAEFMPSRLPEEIRNEMEKELKNYEKKNCKSLENYKNKNPSPTKIKPPENDNAKKGEREKDGYKNMLKKDGGKTDDEKIASPSKTAVSNKKEQHIKAKMRASNIYEYTAGMYPGIHVGHKYCVRPLRLVPKSMGWLWNISDLGGALKPGRGWRPGAVRSNVNSLLKEWRKTQRGIREMKPDQEMEMLRAPIRPTKRLRPTTPKSPGSKKEAETLKLNPTIHLHKKDRFYYVSMYPIKTESQEELGEEPQPIQFKIDRKHPDGRPSGDESCFSSTESSSDSSSYEVEYIAPAALKPKKKKIEKCNMFSQYDEEDFTPRKTIKKPLKAVEEVPEPVKKATKGKKGKKKGKKGGGKKGGKKKK